MIRFFSILVGAFFLLGLAVSAVIDTMNFELPNSAEARFHKHPKELALSSDGPFGKFDKTQLQRGYAVYANVCASCHALKHVSFRDLKALGYSDAAVKAIAAKATINAKDPLTGEMKDRPGLPSDHFPPVVYAGKGVPPDLSLITKARHGGAAYVYSLLTGYQDVPANLPKANHPGEGLYYNPYFANLNLAMPAPLTGEGQVTYSDGTKATVDQMAQDVSAFLVWAAEPKLEQRHQTGLWWILFLVFATTLGYMSYRNIWADKKGH